MFCCCCCCCCSRSADVNVSFSRFNFAVHSPCACYTFPSHSSLSSRMCVPGSLFIYHGHIMNEHVACRLLFSLRSLDVYVCMCVYVSLEYSMHHAKGTLYDFTFSLRFCISTEQQSRSLSIDLLCSCIAVSHFLLPDSDHNLRHREFRESRRCHSNAPWSIKHSNSAKIHQSLRIKWRTFEDAPNIKSLRPLWAHCLITSETSFYQKCWQCIRLWCDELRGQLWHLAYNIESTLNAIFPRIGSNYTDSGILFKCVHTWWMAPMLGTFLLGGTSILGGVRT